VTMISGGFKENVLPSSASAVINHRIHPANSVQGVLEYDKKLINDDRITLEMVGLSIEPHPISPYDDDSFGYQTIKKSIQEVFPNTAVVPGIMLAATDTRWYLPFTRSVYRFSPAVMPTQDMKRFHGHDERISVENYERCVNYYHHIILTSDGSEVPGRKPVKDEL